jgi:hypothetical protein
MDLGSYRDRMGNSRKIQGVGIEDMDDDDEMMLEEDDFEQYRN